MHEKLSFYVFTILLFLWAVEHVVVSALHAASRIRETFDRLFSRKRPSSG